MKFCIFCCTKHSDEKQTELYKSVIEFEKLDVFFKKENADGLSASYNNFLNSKEADEYDAVIFCHDDLYIDDLKLEQKLMKAFDLGYDIVGLAGCINPAIQKPALWHLMAGGVQGGNLRGRVGHFADNNSDDYFVTSFGKTPSRVIILDGLFLAVNIKAAKAAKWKFNENYNFHHYDIASCLDANSKKLRLGVYPINVMHRSHGLKDFDKKFTESEERFLKEYSS